MTSKEKRRTKFHFWVVNRWYESNDERISFCDSLLPFDEFWSKYKKILISEYRKFLRETAKK